MTQTMPLSPNESVNRTCSVKQSGSSCAAATSVSVLRGVNLSKPSCRGTRAGDIQSEQALPPPRRPGFEKDAKDFGRVDQIPAPQTPGVGRQPIGPFQAELL